MTNHFLTSGSAPGRMQRFASDYRTRQIRLVHYLMLSGDVEADLSGIREVYQGCRGLNPECASPINLAVKEQREQHALTP